MNLVFSSVQFIFLFLPGVLFGYYGLIKRRQERRNIFLFLVSIVFYAAGEPLFVLAMLLSIAANWRLALAVAARGDEEKRRRMLWTAVGFNLGMLFVFKYLAFTAASFAVLFGASFHLPKLWLPVGISFFTFQALSYVIDVYRGRGAAQQSFWRVGLYIAFFPQLIAGPIVRYESIVRQLADRRENFSDFSSGVCRFIVGLAKKVLLANQLAVVADAAFQSEEVLSVSMAWLGAVAFTLQIYYDFSGYSDMAIGLGRMFGFHFQENFNYPYISQSASEFWRRWHISLGTWFRDYVYIPLGGSKNVSKRRILGNLFIVWLLTGIWHGANWTFIAWGMLYFVFIAGEKWMQFETRAIPACLKHLYALLLVILGWVLFKADSLGAAAIYFQCMFGFGGALLDDMARLYWSENAWFFLAAGALAVPVSALFSADCRRRGWFAWGYAAGMLTLLLVSISYVIKGAYNPFIYFNF